MAVKKLSNGNYQARFQIDGKRYKKNFPSAREARIWEGNIIDQVSEGKTPNLKADKRRLSEIIGLWYELHGHLLKSGEQRKSNMLHTAMLMGDPLARHLSASKFSGYRARRMKGMQVDAKELVAVTENTCNHELSYLSAMFNELKRNNEWVHDNPLSNVRKLKYDEKEMHYLSTDEIEHLLSICRVSNSESLLSVVEVCLCTGARWGEASSLKACDIRIDKGRAWIVFEGTKSGKVRRVPVSTDFARGVRGNHIGYAPLFKDCLSAFKRALAKSDIQLPKGQATHVLRHTFASHYMMNGGDLLRLQKLLGHASIKMTMRYAHLAPGALEDVIDKNALKSGPKMAQTKEAGQSFD